MNPSFTDGLARLVLDAQFETFETLAERPNLFRIVGRTYTETWHSMFLAWLLDPKGSHQLGSFAIKRFLLAVADESAFAPKGKRPKVRKLSVIGDFTDADVTPNERNPKEKVIPPSGEFKKSGRLDIFVENVSIEEGLIQGKSSAIVLIEQKVFAPPDTVQCQRYHAWLHSELPYSQDTVLHVPVLLGPFDSTNPPIDDDQWFILDYQKLHDDVLVPSLEHQALNERARLLLEQYIDALRIPVTGTKLANSQEEIDLANELYARHKTTFHRLWEILAQDIDDPNLLALIEAKQEAVKAPLVVEIELEEGKVKRLEESSGSKLLQSVMIFLDKEDKLEGLVPFSTGKRYLVAEERVHSNGKPFVGKGEITSKNGKMYYIETNSSRNQSVNFAFKILRAAEFDVSAPDN